MMRVKQTLLCKAPLVAFAVVLLHAVPSCGKVPAPGESTGLSLPPAVNVAETVCITGVVKLAGGQPSKLGEVIDIGGNPFCTGHAQLVNPAWRVGKDAGLADVTISVRGSKRAANLPVETPLVDQKQCEFIPHLSVIQAGQSLRLRNSDLTFHNIRIVRHEIGTRGAGENLANLAQPSQGQENVQAFDKPGIYRLECDVHRWMRAWVYVHEGVHVTKTGENGEFSLGRALEDGAYEVEAWHPMFAKKLLQTVTVRDGKATASFEFVLQQSFEP